jgi:glucokinase
LSSSWWGVDIGGTTTVVGFLSDSGFKVASVIATSPAEGPQSLLCRVASVISAEDPSARGVGVGIAGLVDRSRGLLHLSPNLPGWEELAVADELGSLCRIPVVVDNDCNVFAWGALRTGQIPPEGLMTVLTIGTGIGGTIVLDGRIVYGTGFAGEFGHMPVEASGLQCACGSTGCWERYAALSALLRYCLKEGANVSGSREAAELARRGDTRCMRAFAEFGHWLGLGMAGLANCLSPDGFYIAGGLAATWDLCEGAASKTYGSRCTHLWNVRVIDGAAEAGAAGAAMLARDSLA